MKNKPIKVGEWLVEVESNQMQLLEDAKQQVIFEPKVMDVLACLIEFAGEVVSTQTLIDRCWPNQFLSDNPIHKCINQLRKAFKDNSRNSRYIQTVPKRGYRLSAVVDKAFDQQQVPNFESPYPGERAFNDKEGGIFFGRDYQVQELFYLIKQRQLKAQKGGILVVGEVGVGKTSLVEAGLKPKLLSENIEIVGIDASSTHKVFKQQLQKLQSYCDSSNESLDKATVIVIDHLSLKHLIQQDDDYSIKSEGAERTIKLLELVRQLNQSPNVILIICLRPFDLSLFRQTKKLSSLSENAELYLLEKLSSSDVYLAITRPATLFQLDFEVCSTTGGALAQELQKLFIKNQLSLKQLQGLLYELYQRALSRQLTMESLEQIKRDRNDLWLEHHSHIIEQFKIFSSESLNPLLKKLIKVKFDGTFHIKLIEARLDNFKAPRILILISQLIENKILACYVKKDQVFIRFINQTVIHTLPFTQQWINTHYQSLISQEFISANYELWLSHNRNNDYLLSPGKSLEDARQLLELREDDLSSNHKEYIQSSIKAFAQKQLLKKLMVGTVCTLALISTSALIITNDARVNQHNSGYSAEQLMTFMNQELKRESIPLDKLDLMESLTIEILHYLENSKTVNNSVRLYTAMAQKILGEVYIQQGQLSKALIYFEQTHDLLEEILIEQPQLTKALFELAQVNYWQGYLAYLDSQYPKAVNYWRQHFELSQQLVSLDEENSLYLNELSSAHSNLGRLNIRKYQYQDALEHFEISARLQQKLLISNSADVQIKLADTYSWIARTYDSLGETTNSYRYYQKQLQALVGINQRSPNTTMQKYYLATAYQNMANTNYLLNHMNEALKNLERSQVILNQLTEYEPSNVKFQESKVFTLNKIGKIYRILQRYDLSQLHLSQSLSLAHSLASPTLNSKKGGFYLSKARYEQGRYQQSQGHLKSAFDYYQQALNPSITGADDSLHQELVALIHLRLAELSLIATNITMKGGEKFIVNDSIGESEEREELKQAATSHLYQAKALIKPLIKNNRSLRYRLTYCQIQYYLNENDATQCLGANRQRFTERMNHPEYGNQIEVAIIR